MDQIGPSQFRTFPRWTKIAVIKHNSSSLYQIYPFVKGEETERIAFEIPHFKKEIADGICQWDDKKTQLRLDSWHLKLQHIATVLAEVSDKDQITSLDLGRCGNLSGLFFENQSILEGFNALNTLTLPASNMCFVDRQEKVALKGIEILQEHLENLDLSKSGVESLSCLQGFAKLRILTANYCGMLKDINGIDDCLSIEQLNLKNCSQVSTPKLTVTLPKLINLKTGDFSGIFTLTTLNPFKNLERLEKITVPKKTAGELSERVLIIRV